MIEALWWGFFASSSLVLGGVLALRFSIPSRVLGLVMAFGAGVLISSVSYELVEEAFDTSTGGVGVGLGLATEGYTLRLAGVPPETLEVLRRDTWFVDAEAAGLVFATVDDAVAAD